MPGKGAFLIQESGMKTAGKPRIGNAGVVHGTS
jgi:hypothetical protein